MCCNVQRFRFCKGYQKPSTAQTPDTTWTWPGSRLKYAACVWSAECRLPPKCQVAMSKDVRCDVIYAGWSEHDVSRGSCVVRGCWVTPSPVTAPHSSCRHATAEETQCRRGEDGWRVSSDCGADVDNNHSAEIRDCEVRL